MRLVNFILDPCFSFLFFFLYVVAQAKCPYSSGTAPQLGKAKAIIISSLRSHLVKKKPPPSEEVPQTGTSSPPHKDSVDTSDRPPGFKKQQKGLRKDAQTTRNPVVRSGKLQSWTVYFTRCRTSESLQSGLPVAYSRDVRERGAELFL